MRVALVVPGGVDRSGRERVIPVLLRLIERLSLRHEVHVVALLQEREPGEWPLLGATVHNLGEPPVAGGPGRIAWWERRLLHVLPRRRRVDVLHGFWGEGAGFLAALAGKLRGIPSVVTLAGGELVWLPSIGYGSLGRPERSGQVLFAMRAASALTVATRFMERAARALGASPRLVPLGIDPRPFEGTRPPRRHGRYVLASLASLSPVKDPGTLLESLALLRAAGLDAVLEAAGADTTGGEAARLAARLGVEPFVSFHGPVDEGAVAGILSRADLHVLPSLHDAAPVAVLEAAASGVPTVGTPVGWVADWAPDAAVAVPAGNPAALAAAIRSLLLDPDRRAAIARQARARVPLADDTAAAFEALYAEVARG